MKFSRFLFKPVDNSALIIFRILFGALLCYQFSDQLFSGVIYRNFIKPPFTFNYIGFDFLQPLPGNGMYVYVALMILLALMIMIGAWYRIAVTGFSFLYTAMYLMQKSAYNNHYYLILLLCWIMVFMPANRYFSVDAKRKAVTSTIYCANWCILIFIAQIAIVYFFAAISKINSDWFTGKFIAIQFSSLARRPVHGIIYGKHWFQMFICYAGFLFDLLIVPLLLWKKTRNYAFIAACLFHLFNAVSFNIGIFPFLAIVLNIFFLDPALLRRLFFKRNIIKLDNYHSTNNSIQQKIILCSLAVYFFFQLIIPMRSWFYHGNVFWTEEGYRMSWKMMMRTKDGSIYFKVVDDDSHQTWIIDPLKTFSKAHVIWIAISPDIIWQYSQRIKSDYAKKGIMHIKIFAFTQVSLNRSKPMPLIDTTADLASIQWQPFKHSLWITKGP